MTTTTTNNDEATITVALQELQTLAQRWRNREQEARDERARETAETHPTFQAFSPLQQRAARAALETAGGEPDLVSERVGEHAQQSWEEPAAHLLTQEQAQEVYVFVLSLYT